MSMRPTTRIGLYAICGIFLCIMMLAALDYGLNDAHYDTSGASILNVIIDAFEIKENIRGLFIIFVPFLFLFAISALYIFSGTFIVCLVLEIYFKIKSKLK